MTSVPSIPKASTAEPSEKQKSGIARYAMWACCVVMALPIVALLASGGLSGVFSSAGAFLPLVACLGLHLLMYRMMGRSCHGGENAQPRVPASESEPGLAIRTTRTGEREAS